MGTNIRFFFETCKLVVCVLLHAMLYLLSNNKVAICIILSFCISLGELIANNVKLTTI